MAKQKPAVLLYFKPMHKEVLELDDRRCAALFRAIMEYADPETQIEPDFSNDEVLAHIWNWARPSLDRDDETYTRKIGNRYSAFCKHSKENGYSPPLSREEWDAAGQPNFKQWVMYQSAPEAWALERMQSQYDAGASHTAQYDAGATHTAHCVAGASHENARKRSSDSDSKSDSVSLSTSDTGAGASTPSGAFAPGTVVSPALSPGILREALEKWRGHWEELHQSPMPSSTRAALAEELKQQAEDYNPYAVADFVQKCISNGYKSLPWDKLMREEAARFRELEQAADREKW